MKSHTTFQTFFTFFLLCFLNLGCTAQIQRLYYEGTFCDFYYSENS